MARYWYDRKCRDCERGCHFHGEGAFPDGTPYERCSCYGYILHPERGVEEVDCDGYMSEEVWQAESERREKRERQLKANRNRK